MSLLHLPLPCPPQCSIPHLGTSIAKGVATAAASTVLTAMSDWVVGGASWLVAHIVGLVSPPTSISLDASWFADRERAMVEIAGLLVGPLVAAATLGAVIRQDGRRLARIFGVGLPVGILGTATAIALTQLALRLVDALCQLITPTDPYRPLLQLGRAIAQQQIPIFVQFIVSFVVVLAAVVLWMEMVLRAAVLYIVLFFLPLGLAAFVWPATAHITRRFIELVGAIVGSKFVIVATLTLGGAAMGQGRVGVDGAVTGTAILLLAAFAPFAVLRLVPVVEAAATAHLEGMSRRPARGVMAASGAVSSGARLAGTLGLLGGGTGEALAARAVAATDVGHQIGSWPVPPARSPGSPVPSRSGASAVDDGPASAVDDGPASTGYDGPASTGYDGSSPAVHDVPSSGVSRSDAGGSSGGSSGPGGLAGSSPPSGRAGPRPGSTRSAPFAGEPPAPSSAPPPPHPAPPPPVQPGIIGEDLDGWSDDA